MVDMDLPHFCREILLDQRSSQHFWLWICRKITNPGIVLSWDLDRSWSFVLGFRRIIDVSLGPTNASGGHIPSSALGCYGAGRCSHLREK